MITQFAKHANRLRKFRALYDEANPPPRPATVADVVRLWRDAFAYLFVRASEEHVYGCVEWQALFAAAEHTSPHNRERDDEKFLALVRGFALHLSAGLGDPLPEVLFGAPPVWAWRRFKGDVDIAWKCGLPPHVYSARQATEAQELVPAAPVWSATECLEHGYPSGR